MQKQNDFAIFRPFIYILPLNPIDQGVLVVQLGVNCIMCGLKFRAELRVFCGQIFSANRRIDPED
jgi:hypothetical protein